MEERRYNRRNQVLVMASASLLFVLVLVAWITGAAGREWHGIQHDFAKLAKEKGLEQAPERGILQVELSRLDRVDRCITCHNGIGTPEMKGMPQPHSDHPGQLLESHPMREYGCTICHGGQGRALSREEAFGQAPGTHWSRPLLGQPYIQSSCGKCHLAIFGSPEEGTAENMEIFAEGRELFSREGCLGCHKARGVGGILGPDLTRQGEKTRHEYSFQKVEGEQTVSNWLKEHFRDPEMVSPGSQMLRVNLEEKDLDALATFVMGLAKPDIPLDYFTLPTLREFKGIRDTLKGPTAFAYLCSACHGKQGEGKSFTTYKTGVPSIGNRDFRRVASREFIRFTLEKGRSQRQMSSWTRSISEIGSGELDDVAVYVKEGMGSEREHMEFPGRGEVEHGLTLFDRYCSVCHGHRGTGGVAVALNQQGLLSVADDEFLLQTLLRGRGNTAMPAWDHLEDEELAGLVAAIRSWGAEEFRELPVTLPAADREEGAMSYHFLCSRCHGENGEGGTGPSIINRDFLEAASDRYLYLTIARGRAHTAMFGWSSDVYNQERLNRQDISNIIAYIRGSSGRQLTYIYPGANPGSRQRGEILFTKRCAVCHGPEGEGLKAPALNNQEFLSAASNGYLMAMITLGRSGTAMPSWGYGQEDYPALSAEERQDLVARIRSWQRIRIRY